MNESLLNIQELAEIARSRASVFAFLNIHFNNLPDQAFVRHIRSNNFQFALNDLLEADEPDSDLVIGVNLMKRFIDSYIDMSEAGLSDTLGVDRTRLYRGLSPSYGPPPPYEAVWSKSARNVTEVLQTVSGIYQADGMAVSPQAKDRLDYLGVEMDYIYQLAMREAETWEAGNEASARGLLERQDSFMREHLNWVPWFVEKSLTMAQTDFYRGHLKMVRGYIAGETERVHALLEEFRVTA